MTELEKEREQAAARNREYLKYAAWAEVEFGSKPLTGTLCETRNSCWRAWQARAALDSTVPTAVAGQSDRALASGAYLHGGAVLLDSAEKTDSLLAHISSRKQVLKEAYGFTEQTADEGATEIDDSWGDAIQRGYGEWCALCTMRDLLIREEE